MKALTGSAVRRIVARGDRLVASGKLAPARPATRQQPIGDKPLFSSIYDALRWAWYGSVDAGNTVDGASYVEYQSEDKRDKLDPEDAPPPRRINIDLSAKPRGYDASAQAGIIKNAVGQLPAVEFYHVIAKFLIGGERVIGRTHLQPHVITIMGVEGRDAEAVAMLLARFYGKKRITIASVSKRLKLNRRRVTALNVSLLAEMDAIGYRAETRLYEKLQAMGVVR